MRMLAFPALLLLLLVVVLIVITRGLTTARTERAPGADAAAAAPSGAKQTRPRSRDEQLALRAERLLKEFDLSDPRVELEELIAGVPRKDSIPALTDPQRAPVRSADYPPDGGRVVAVELNGAAVAYPLGILNWHEIANDTVGGVPIAVTYCPLCDSVSVLDRRLDVDGDGSAELTVEFGVSGLLHNSNVVMYERSTDALWSQVFMQAITGPHAGRSLDHLPVKMMTFGEFKSAHPEGEVLTTNTGHDRRYNFNPYEDYFTSDRLYIDMEFGDALPAKTLGMGVLVDGQAMFITAAAAYDEPVTIETPSGPFIIEGDEQAGLTVRAAPDDVTYVQTFYHSWSSFFPETRIIGIDAAKPATTPSETQAADGNG